MSNALGFSALHGGAGICGEPWRGDMTWPCTRDAGHQPPHRTLGGVEFYDAIQPAQPVPTLGQFTAIVAALFGVKPDQLGGWLVLVHDTKHQMGYMSSAFSVEEPPDKVEVIELLEEALRQVRDQA